MAEGTRPEMTHPRITSGFQTLVVRPSEAVKIPRRGWIVREARPIASPVRGVPSPIYSILGENQEVDLADFVANLYGHIPAALLSSALVVEPTLNLANSLLMLGRDGLVARPGLLGGFREWLRNFFDGVRVVRRRPTETMWIPLTEIHRPKVPGCVSELSLQYEQSADYSFEVSVVSIGGGAGKGRKVGYSDTISCEGDCLRLELPVEVQVEECVNRVGIPFSRYSVVRIDDNYQPVPIRGASDACQGGLGRPGIPHVRDFSVPSGTTWTRTMSLSSGTSASVNIGLDLPGIAFGLKYSVTLLSSAEFSYTLIGPKTYVAFQRSSTITYYWAWG